MRTVFDIELFVKRGFGIDLDYEDGVFYADIYKDFPSNCVGEGVSKRGMSEAIEDALRSMRERGGAR